MSSMVMSMRLSSAPVSAGDASVDRLAHGVGERVDGGTEGDDESDGDAEAAGFGGVVGDGFGGGEDDAGHGGGDALDHLADDGVADARLVRGGGRAGWSRRRGGRACGRGP